MLINGNFRRLWAGQAISSLGDEIFDTTLLLWVGIVLLAGKSYAPAVSTAVLVITSTVTIVLGPLAGVFVDRWDKRRLMLRTDLVRAVLVGILAVVSVFAKHIPLPVILGVIALTVALQSAASQFFGPARIVMIRDVVPGEQIGRANSFGATAQSVAGIIGPPLAAPLLVGVSVSWAIAVNAVSFAASYLFVRSIKGPAVPVVVPAEHPSVRKELAEGLRYIVRDRIIRAVMVTAIVVNLGAGVIMSLNVYFVGENLHADPKWFGLLGGAFSIGVILGTAMGGMIADKAGATRVVATGLVTLGIFLVAYSRVASVYPAVAASIAMGLSMGTLNAAIFPVFVNHVPRELLGRVGAVLTPANRIGSIVSMVLAAVLVSTVLYGLDGTVAGVHFGRIDVVFGVGGLITMTSGLYFWYATRSPDATAPAPPVSLPAQRDDAAEPEKAV